MSFLPVVRQHDSVRLIYNHFILIAETKTHRVEPDITVFEISGRLYLGDPLKSVEAEIRKLIEGGARKLVIDLTDLKSIDSSGIGVVINCGEELVRLGGEIRLAGAHGSVAKILATIRIDRIIPVDDDLASACARFSSSAASV
jgi:anti-sigma B factor antagonist